MEERLHPNLVLECKGAIEILRVDREDSLGALNFEIMEALGSYIQDLNQRKEDVRVLIITGTGRGFVAGADIVGYHKVGQTVFDNFQRRSRTTFDAIASLPQLTICAVNGYALGGGLELALCCDFILVNEKTKLGLPEIKLGLLPGGGGTQRLPRLVGPMRAKEMLATGRMITAEEAVQYGIALEAHAPDELMPRALEFAETLASQAPIALLESKRVVDDGLDTALSAGLTMEQRVLGALYATEDGKEGIAAFIEKRDSEFKGR
ncbi:MAG: enoyl-CoA hydratase/isomerase family protein [Rhizobiaceae bacterium]